MGPQLLERSELANRADVSPSPIRSWWPWQVCFFLLLAVCLSYLDRQALSVVAPLVIREMNLDNASLGLLLSAFFWSFALMHLVVGWALDRFNIRFAYGLCVALWSCAQILSGVSNSFATLFTARLLLGTFETAGQTGAARIISRILPAKDRAMANGIMMSGGSVGAMIAAPIMIGLAHTVGWRVGFMLLGGVGLIWALAWTIWFRPPADILYGGGGHARAKEPWQKILTAPPFWACVIGAACTIPIIHISSSWIPTYFVQAWGLRLDRDFALYLFLIYFGLDVGFLGGGAAVSYFIRQGKSVARARKIVMLVSALLMLLAAAVPLAPSAAWAIVLVFLLNTGRAAWGAIFLSFNQDVSPERVGMIAAIMGCIGSLVGAVLIWAIGAISQSAGFNVPFIMIGLLAFIGAIPVLLVRWEKMEPPVVFKVEPAPVAVLKH
jgi:MFS transporter, ACS family, D-galactonate transporter